MNKQECVCPVCNGSKQVELSDREISYSWNRGKTHKECDNCGGQTMMGRATGISYLRADNTPCIHDYRQRQLGRSYTEYRCIHCNYTYEIDSSG